mmetsp:Transcript_55963/g.76357  ORF Transcript_55963/g.76357 Transcript_55963/m.76357 type:complete len:175 (+) Transcript_55963:116-640(+)
MYQFMTKLGNLLCCQYIFKEPNRDAARLVVPTREILHQCMRLLPGDDAFIRMLGLFVTLYPRLKRALPPSSPKVAQGSVELLRLDDPCAVSIKKCDALLNLFLRQTQAARFRNVVEVSKSHRLTPSSPFYPCGFSSPSCACRRRPPPPLPHHPWAAASTDIPEPGLPGRTPRGL